MSYNSSHIPLVMYRKFLLGLLNDQTKVLIMNNSTPEEQQKMLLAALQQIIDDFWNAQLNENEYRNFLLLIMAE